MGYDRLLGMSIDMVYLFCSTSHHVVAVAVGVLKFPDVNDLGW